jgi:hypothetical protein
MDRTTIDESNNESEHTDSSNSSGQEARLSSDTLEANIEFVSSEEDLAASSTKSGTIEEHDEHASRDDYSPLIVKGMTRQQQLVYKYGRKLSYHNDNQPVMELPQPQLCARTK